MISCYSNSIPNRARFSYELKLFHDFQMAYCPDFVQNFRRCNLILITYSIQRYAFLSFREWNFLNDGSCYLTLVLVDRLLIPQRLVKFEKTSFYCIFWVDYMTKMLGKEILSIFVN